MYKDLVKRLNAYSAEHECHGGITAEAADAIEELVDTVKAYQDVTDMVVEEAPGKMAIRFERKWIPVTEWLPSPEVEVLVFTRDRRIGVDKLFGVLFGLPTFAKKGARRITHWMPLPPPPEEGEP